MATDLSLGCMFRLLYLAVSTVSIRVLNISDRVLNLGHHFCADGFVNSFLYLSIDYTHPTVQFLPDYIILLIHEDICISG